MAADQPQLLTEFIDASFAMDSRRRLTGSAPTLHVLRGPDFALCHCHADLPDHVVVELEALVARPRGRPSRWQDEWGDIVRRVSQVAPITAIRAGPLYSFGELAVADPACVAITPANANLLRGGLGEWLADVEAGVPMIAAVADGHAVAVCASVARSASVHAAGVETLPSQRGKHFGAKAVTAWAHMVRSAGATPFYATTFDNLASQGLARQLGLRAVGAEFSVTLERPGSVGV